MGPAIKFTVCTEECFIMYRATSTHWSCSSLSQPDISGKPIPPLQYLSCLLPASFLQCQISVLCDLPVSARRDSWLGYSLCFNGSHDRVGEGMAKIWAMYSNKGWLYLHDLGLFYNELALLVLFTLLKCLLLKSAVGFSTR